MNAVPNSWIAIFGTRDPQVPAAALEAMDPTRLHGVSGETSRLAMALSAGRQTVERAIGQVSAAWSSPAPRAGLTSLAAVVGDTASLLQRQSAAMESAAAQLDRAKSNGRLDWALASAELQQIRLEGGGGLLTALTGVPQVGSAARIISVVNELTAALNARVAEADRALAELSSVLELDPNAGPDRLHVGPGALVPPDPFGGPAARTDRHNRELVAADLRSGDPIRIKFAIAITRSLQKASDRGGQPELVTYDPTAWRGQGRAAIAVGDLARASNVAIVVPGIGNSPSDMDGGVQVAANLRDEANQQDPSHPTAAVAWYGYDIPLSAGKDPGASLGIRVSDTLAAATAWNAATGAPVLAADLASIKAMSQASTRMTLLGFSMGSTTVSEAARYALPVDSIVLLGSPGAGWDTSSAAGYRNVPASQVYTLSYDQDPITLPITDDLISQNLLIENPFGPDPAEDDFGGNHIDASTNVPVRTGTGLLSSLTGVVGDPRHHSLTNYTQGKALAAEGAIITGRTDQVPRKRGRPRR